MSTCRNMLDVAAEQSSCLALEGVATALADFSFRVLQTEKARLWRRLILEKILLWYHIE